MKKVLIAVIFLVACNLFAQGTAGEDAKFEYRYLIDMPSSGILEKGYVNVSSDILPNGVLISRLEVGAFDGVSFGISYGGENLRFRLMDEALNMPALSIGFDSQGKGVYFDSSNRFEIKSPGFFASASKNFEFFGYLSLHGCVNYSLESKDGDNFLNMMMGFEKTIGKKVSFNMEYNFAFNDNAAKKFGKGNGYLNLGVRWSVGEGLTLGLDLRDLLNNKKWSPGAADRAIKMEFIKSIF